MDKRIKESGLGRRFWSRNFQNIEKRGVPKQVEQQYQLVRNYAANLPENIREGNGLLLLGPVGTLKTSLASAVLLTHLYTGGTGLFITMSSLLDTIFTLKSTNMDEWAKFEYKLRNAPILVIDDLGAEHTEGWVKTKVDSIISERYNSMLPIIITTNLTGEQLKNTYAERIIDRIRSTAEQVIFSGDSLRERKGA